MSDRFLPYGRQTIGDDDVAAVVEVLRGEWLTTGPKVAEFEAAFAAAVEAPHAVVCSSGTAALHLAAMALGLGPGDEVIVPTVTFLASANGPHYTGAEIVFADVDPDTGLLTAETLEEAISRAGPGLKAAIPVHLNGHACDMEALAAVAARHGLRLIEDASHAIGTRYREREAGGWVAVGSGKDAALATFSFHAVKTIAMGEGGAVTTRDEVLARSMRRQRSHGMERESARFTDTERAFDGEGRPNPWYYEMSAVGFNYRASDLQCALGLSQLRKLDAFAAQRRRLARLYDQRLSGQRTIRPVTAREGCDPVPHLYAVLVEFGTGGIPSRADVMRTLAARGVGTQVHYQPVHLQPYYRTRHGGLRLPGAEGYYRRCLSIPLFPGMEAADVERVVAALEEALQPTR